MKQSFYIKLFLNFIFFSTIILLFAFFSFEKFYKDEILINSVDENFELVLKKQDEMTNLIQSNTNQIKRIKNSKALKVYEQTKQQKLLVELFDTLASSNQSLLSLQYIDKNAIEKIRIKNSDNQIRLVQDYKLSRFSNKDIVSKVIDLSSNEVYVSTVLINKEDEAIAFPVKSIIKFALKTQDGFLILTVDINSYIKNFQNRAKGDLYILDESGNFIIHKNSKYNWSKFFSPNKELQTSVFSKYSNSILRLEEFSNDLLVSKRLYLNNSNYINILIELNQTSITNASKRFDSYFKSIIIIGVVIALILTIIFIEPIAKANKKIVEKNKDLDLNAKKSSQELNENLNIVDKHVIYIKTDINEAITDVSSAFCDITGFSKGEIIGHPHKILLHPDTTNEEYNEIWEHLMKGNQHSVELKCLKKDGTYFWSESFIEPNFNEDNEVVGFTTIRNNITDKKTIQTLYNDLNIQVSQYNTIFENVDSGIALVDLKGNFKKINRVFSSFLEYKQNELLSMSCYDVIIETSKEIVKKLFEETYQIGSIKKIEKIFVSKSNEEVHLELSLSLLPDKKHIVVVVNSLRDKRELQLLNQNLENKIAKEVEKSRQKDRIHQEEQLKNAKLSSIGALAAGITHEINTPLTYIKGNFEMMGYDIDDLPQSDIKTRMQEDSIKINEGINRIANIVESMREISQSSSETKEEVNLYSTLVTALTMAYNRSKQICKIYLQGNEFSIDRVDKHEYKYVTMVQKQRVEQVWIIIINNALDELIKIDDYNNRELKIDIVEDEQRYFVKFKDNAGGISNNILTNIFDPFISSKEHSGMGVGLNIAKRIIEQQKGEIKAYNEKNGAVFEVVLQKHESS
ncbi:MAG: PAS domain S-box protein [Campylobacterota bacterium]